jgi:hypothetical protein
MPVGYTDVGVVVAKRKLKGPWADHAWLPVAVLPEPPAAAPWTPLGRDGDDELFYLGSAALEFHTVETGNYRDNLLTDTPRLWVAIRPSLGDTPVELVMVTADPAEGEALTEPGTDIVETVPMPPEVAAMLASFYAEHHVERVFVKRKRDRANPEALAGGGQQGRRPRQDEAG